MRKGRTSGSRENLIKNARFSYSEIYRWHQAHGKAEFDTRFRTSPEFLTYRKKYLEVLDALVAPRKASTANMASVAREVLTGRLEWSYWEKSDHGVDLQDLARSIKKDLGDYERAFADELEKRKLKEFKNLGSNGQVCASIQIDIPVRDDEEWTTERYLEYANVVYKDVPETDPVGGRIFLTQTNLERSAHALKDRYTFHNARLLHVEIVSDKRSLKARLMREELFVDGVILGE